MKAEYCPAEQLCVSSQCGFASTAEGNLIIGEAQWKKLDLVREALGPIEFIGNPHLK